MPQLHLQLPEGDNDYDDGDVADDADDADDDDDDDDDDDRCRRANQGVVANMFYHKYFMTRTVFGAPRRDKNWGRTSRDRGGRHGAWLDAASLTGISGALGETMSLLVFGFFCFTFSLKECSSSLLIMFAVSL